MTDLRKAAQDAIDQWDNTGYLDTRPTSYALMNTLREAFDKEHPQSNYGRCIAVKIRAMSKP